jgi:hypothetical protein
MKFLNFIKDLFKTTHIYRQNFEIGKCYQMEENDDPFDDSVCIIKVLDKKDNYIKFVRIIDFGYGLIEIKDSESDKISYLDRCFTREFNGEYKNISDTVKN